MISVGQLSYDSLFASEWGGGTISDGSFTRRTFLGLPILGVPLTQFDPNAGNLKGDQSDLLNNALAWCRKNRRGLFVGPGDYLVKKSLDATGESGGSALHIIGSGLGSTNIIHELDDELPVIDMTGNGRAIVSSLTIREGRNSKASVGILIAKSVKGGSAGNRVTLADLSIQAGTRSDHAGVVIYNADLSRVFNSEIYSGGAALVVGGGKPNAITSSFAGISDSLDSTQFYINECELMGRLAPALDYTGGAALSLQNVYATLTGEGSGNIVRVSSPFPRTGNSLWAHGLRTENQSSFEGTSAVHFSARSLSGQILGNLNTDRAGVTLSSDGGVKVSRYRIDVNAANSAQRLFNLRGGLINSEVRTNQTMLGQIFGGEIGGLCFVGALTRKMIQESIPDAKNVTVSTHDGLFHY